ncbi:MAG: hypothetical protein OEV92_03700 [Nitrospinota bacterium]|nr:hypothetical protein [Nitrospinota bacterium]
MAGDNRLDDNAGEHKKDKDDYHDDQRALADKKFILILAHGKTSVLDGQV